MLDVLLHRVGESRRFLQVLFGPRQVGKTTLARQLVDRIGIGAHMASADLPTGETGAWIEAQWQIARIRSGDGPFLLVLDEVQKVPDWSIRVKRLWDEDTAAGRELRVLMLGSSPLLMQMGLSESTDSLQSPSDCRHAARHRPLVPSSSSGRAAADDSRS